MANYRVVKDGVSVHVPPEMVEFYASKGYRIFRPAEYEITNIPTEIEEASNVNQSDLPIRIDAPTGE